MWFSILSSSFRVPSIALAVLGIPGRGRCSPIRVGWHQGRLRSWSNQERGRRSAGQTATKGFCVVHIIAVVAVGLTAGRATHCYSIPITSPLTGRKPIVPQQPALLRYPGFKWRLAPIIVSQFGKHYHQASRGIPRL